MKEYWDELFKNREKSFTHEAILEEYIEFFQGKRLVELGAGDGRNCCYLNEKGIDITAFDYSEEGIKKIGHKNPSIKTQLIDIEREEIDLKSFQIVLFVHYFPNFEKFREMFETLTNEAIVFIYTFVKEEVNGGRKIIGMSYEEVEKINSIGTIVRKDFIADGRGKSILLILKKG